MPFQGRLISHFMVPTTIRGSYRKCRYGGNPSQSSNQSFSSNRGNSNNRGLRGCFDPIQGDEGMENPPLNDSLKASLSPPVGGRLHSFRFSQSSPDLIRLQGPSKRPSSGLFYPVSSVKECNRKGEKCKISRLFLVAKPHQSWKPVIELSRLNTFLPVERFKMETPEYIRASLIPGEWVSSIELSGAYLHIPIHPNSRKYLRFCHKSQVFQFTSLLFGLARAPLVFIMIVKEVKLVALTRGIGLHHYLNDWLIRAQSQEEAQVSTQTVVDLTQSLGWIISL